MKLSKLKERIDFLVSRSDTDNEVRIVRNDTSIGGVAKTSIETIVNGFDQEKGYTLIYPSEKLFLRNDEDEVTRLRKIIDGLVQENRSLISQIKSFGAVPCIKEFRF